MINVTNEFKELMKTRTDFKENAQIMFADGSTLNLSEDDFSMSNNGVVDSAGANSIPLGCAICRNIQIELLNDDDHLKEYDFYGAKIRLYLTFELSETTEKIEYGTYTVITPETYGTTVLVTAVDDMYKADKAYTTALPFPATAANVLADACTICGITLGSTSFLHSDYVIQEKPSDKYTYRQIIGYIAMIACGNARIDRTGHLQVMTYSFDWTNAHKLTEWSNLTVDTSDITVTGIQMERTAKRTIDGKEQELKETVLVGTKRYVLTVVNPLVTGNEGTLISWIYAVFKDVSFRKFEGDSFGYPIAEFMDMAKITDWKGNEYNTFLTDVNFNFFGFTTMKNSAESGLRLASQYSNGETRADIKAADLVSRERSARETAVQKLQDAAANASGMYETRVELEDKSVITYLHDKPTLKESLVVIKITAEAVAVSNDGGKTYPYGMILTGDLITKMLYAEGINADYIDTGTLVVRDKDGNVKFLVDLTTGQVVINADSIKIGGQTVGDLIDEKTKSLTSNLTMSLTNDYRAISVDSNGDYSTFPNDIITAPTVMYGSEDVTGQCTYTVAKSDTLTGAWDSSKRQYTVTGLTDDTGWVDITAVYLDNLRITKRFSVSKVYNGQSGVTYGLITSSPIIKKTSQSELTPTYVDFTAYYTVGKDMTKYALNVRFVIEEVLNDDGVWRTVYTSTQDESEVRRSLYTVLTTKDGKVPVSKDGKYAFGYPRNVTSIRCRFYAAGGTTQLLGEQTCAVVADATAQLSQSDIVEILSDGGRWNGLYYKNGKLYTSFSAALGGELTLGGKGNGNGKLAIRNDTGKQIGYVDNTGVHFNQGEFSGLFAGELSSPLGNIGGWKISNNPKCIYSGDAPGDAGITLYSSGRMKIQYIDETAGVIEAETTLDVIDGRIHTYQQTLVSATLTDCDLSNPTRLLNPPTVSSGGHIVFAADGMTLAYLGSSSKRYKNHVKDISDEDVQKLFEIPVVYFKYKDGYLDASDKKNGIPIPGFYAEDMEQAFPDAVMYEDGKVEDWNYRTLIPAMEKQIQILYKQNQELMKSIKELKEAQNNGNKL
ncbi:tail fiber domain-containing protein [Blautia ammoniilytica]|uniref:Tail fiber domain-containing protein n=1 Tax=Blautia ammoniilytica TaxID=2981782 RepID=A0ABT2TQ27_9FIRM|nr:tail fiber domain-containing protein [Blautia ammoniilytica]MCU6764330.1 tail fiber domain-containing protein [Blautia ammoniilytica]SCH31038.1 Uncharacterised protein [uncultured Blautia sp.]